MALPAFQEKLISQLPAVALLQNLGYEYLRVNKSRSRSNSKRADICRSLSILLAR